jgi:Sec-independent protein translocase protein TatA
MMFGLSWSELGMVLFILLLIVAASKLPALGEALGSYLYRSRASRNGGGAGEK